MEVAFRRREQEVWQACDDLWALHGDVKHLTGDAIRDCLVSLGKSRGSPNEIYKYRKSWSLSRRIGNNLATEQVEDTDPISRAVRMVHEKLLAEAEEKMDAQRKDFEIKLCEKQQELEIKQRDLSQVINELGHTNTEYNKTQSELKEHKQLLEAEIEVRKALERELAYSKSEHQKVTHELKAAHQSMLEQITHIYLNEEKNRQAQIERLETEKKQLGFEFSEKITEVKTNTYAQALTIKNLQADFAQQEIIVAEKTQFIKSQENKLKIMLEEFMAIKNTNHVLTAKIELLEATQVAIRREYRNMNITNKKNEITIARLRAIRSFAGGHHGSGVAAKKGTAQRALATSSKRGQDSGSTISLQNSCPQ